MTAAALTMLAVLAAKHFAPQFHPLLLTLVVSGIGAVAIYGAALFQLQRELLMNLWSLFSPKLGQASVPK